MDCILIGVLGTGNVGRTLAAGLAAEGHQVSVGGREPNRPELVDWSQTTGVPVADLASVAAGADVIVLATAWEGAENTLRLASGRPEGGLSNSGLSNSGLSNKVLIDATNPLQFSDRLGLAVGHTDSGGEQVQRWAPEARVVKAFNTVGLELMVHPQLVDGPPTMFVAGDDAEAKAVAGGLAHQLGWHVHDCGDLRAARLTEPLALLWIEHALGSGQRDHAFRLLGIERAP